MTVGWVYDEAFERHETGPGHPERPQRLRAIVSGLEASGLAERLHRIDFQPAGPEGPALVHDTAYIDRVAAAWERPPEAPEVLAGGLPPDVVAGGLRVLDSGDTPICEHSYSAALLATGGVLAACEAVMAGWLRRAFCAVRPPGHHAERAHAMGFCLFNHIAIAAEHLIRRHGLERVAIVDFDVHHGNGTQHAFERRADVLFISIHEDPRYLYPGTGYASERGEGAGRGYTLNIPMAPGSGDDDYRAAFESEVLPKLDAQRPQVLLVSAGFDAAREDPLAHIELTDRAFGWMTRRLVEAAERHCGGRLVSTLEGGYDLAALSRGVNAHIAELLD